MSAPRRGHGDRLAAFTTVGAGGFLVQMACLGVLTAAGVHYVIAAGLALEAAILHNVVWHAHWTWGDRRVARRHPLRAMGRANLLYGATALMGLALTIVLVESLHLHVMLAAAASVAVCAAINYIASDRTIFAVAALAATAVAPIGARPASAEPSPAAALAFERLAAAVQDAIAAGWQRASDGSTLPHDLPADSRQRVRGGEVLVEPGDGDGVVPCADALCHLWWGSVFVPSHSPDAVVALMQAYDDYPALYDPAVRRSTLVARHGDRFTVDLQLVARKLIVVVLNARYDVRYLRVSEGHVQIDSRSIRIAEVADAGTSAERERPPGQETGFLWRSNTTCLLTGRPEGTWVQCASISLTRRVPTALRWVVTPLVSSVPRESLAFTLGRLREKVIENRAVRGSGFQVPGSRSGFGVRGSGFEVDGSGFVRSSAFEVVARSSAFVPSSGRGIRGVSGRALLPGRPGELLNTEPRRTNPRARTPNPEPRTPNANPEPGTRNPEQHALLSHPPSPPPAP